MKVKKENFVSAILYCLIAVFSGVFVFCFSGSTSPLLPNFYGDDSAMFQIIGKAWTEGITPYVGVFDHKGPFIFFVNALGYLMGRYGLVVVQWLFMTVTFCVLLRIMLLFTNKYIAFLGVVFSYGILAATYDLGNYTEEYSLLFITVSMYLGIKFLLKNETETKEHPWKYAIWYGISFAAIALMRVTSAFAICCIILVILCILVKNKLWKNIGQNILAFGVGMCIVFFPFVIYFASKNALYDMIYGTIIHNVLYAEVSSFWTEGDAWRAVYMALYTTLLLFISSVISIIVHRRKKLSLHLLGILISVGTFCMFIKMNRYLHYYMITVPYFAFSVGMIVNILKERKKNVVSKLCTVIVSVCLLGQLYISVNRINTAKYQVDVFAKYADDYEKCCSKLMSHVPKDEYAETLVFGSNVLSQWYLVADLTPIYRYCMLQGWMASCSEEIKKNIIKYLEQNPAKWLVVDSDFETERIAENHCKQFADIIQKRYRLVDTQKMENDGLCFQIYELVD